MKPTEAIQSKMEHGKSGCSMLHLAPQRSRSLQIAPDRSTLEQNFKHPPYERHSARDDLVRRLSYP